MSLTNQNIEQLVELCKTGNQFAQLEVYNRYYKAMYNTALRIVKDTYEAEDIMQDAFLTAFTKLDSLKEAITFGAWLKRIVINDSIYRFNKSNKYKLFITRMKHKDNCYSFSKKSYYLFKLHLSTMA